jgi:hypothetical protein
LKENRIAGEQILVWQMDGMLNHLCLQNSLQTIPPLYTALKELVSATARDAEYARYTIAKFGVLGITIAMANSVMVP